MRYRLIVSEKGKHVFTTGTESPQHLDLLLDLFQKKFKLRDGFEIQVSENVSMSSDYSSINEYRRSKASLKGPRYSGGYE